MNDNARKIKKAFESHRKKHGATKEAAINYLVNILGTHRKNGELRANYGGTSSEVMNYFEYEKRWDSELQNDIYQTALEVNDRLPESDEKSRALSFLLLVFNKPKIEFGLTYIKIALAYVKKASLENRR
jgi:hypothetical protein